MYLVNLKHLFDTPDYGYYSYADLYPCLLYTSRLVETTKANMANTFEYFNLLLTEIPQHIDDKDLIFVENFLPWSPSVHKECPADTKSLDLSMYISIL